MEVLAIAKQNDVLINEQINIPEVMVIGPNGIGDAPFRYR
jgi:translation initiation factor IF-3